MDGLPQKFPMQAATMAQRTLKSPIGCVGVGLHSGRKIGMTLRPAPTDSGIVFHRSDLGIDIPARFDHVVDTRLCTVLAVPDQPEARVGTVEHILAALAGSGVTNVVIEIDGPEIPILDGSAASFVFLIDCAGIVAQAASAPLIEIMRAVRVQHGEDMSIDFTATAIGCQALRTRLTPETFRTELARARTFTQVSEVAALKSVGLALGGSLDNAVVVDEATVLNPGGLRMPDEFIRHKMLDAVGDLALAGAMLRGRLIAHRAGHHLNNLLLRALFADDANWRLLPSLPLRGDSVSASRGGMSDGSANLPTLGSWQERRIRVAAAPV
jgi:UDP-3-O-[3-hydroxymyristoyl] N-acetylglucosamine deacetylase